LVARPQGECASKLITEGKVPINLKGPKKNFFKKRSRSGAEPFKKGGEVYGESGSGLGQAFA